MAPESLEGKEKFHYDLSGIARSPQGKSNQLSNLFAVELSTGKIRTVPIYLSIGQSRSVHFRLYRSMLYCCQPEEWKKEPGERIGYKFNLAVDTLEAVEFKF